MYHLLIMTVKLSWIQIKGEDKETSFKTNILAVLKMVALTMLQKFKYLSCNTTLAHGRLKQEKYWHDTQNNLVEWESLKRPYISEQSYFPNTLECDSDQVGSEERFLWDCVFCFWMKHLYTALPVLQPALLGTCCCLGRSPWVLAD